MYKAKKRWVVAGVTMFSAVLGTTALASADTVNSTSQVKVPVASSVVSSQNNSTSKTNTSEVSTESQNNETKQTVSSNQGSEQQVPITPANSSSMVKKATVASATTISSTPSVPVKTVTQNNSSVTETPKVQANSETVKKTQTQSQSSSVAESETVSSNTDNVSKTSVSTTNSSTQNSAVSQSQEPTKAQSNVFSAPKASQINPATAYRHQLRAYQQSFSADVVPSHSTGIDISDYQDNDVIYTLHNDGAKFVIVKTSQGSSNGGAVHAGEKIQIAKNLGMEVQGYHYATFGGNVAQAQREGIHAVANAKYYGVPTGSYLACDYETGASGSVSANTQAVEAFMDEVKKGGYIPLLYSGYYYLKDNINYSDVIRRYGNCLWIADYNGNNITPDFEYFPSLPGIIMWQFSDNDHGVDGDVCVLPLTVSNGQSTAVDNTPSNTPVNNNNQDTGSESTWTDAQGVVWHNETGTFTTNTPVNLRWGATPQSSLIATLSAGSQINYDAWADSDGYVWLRQPRNDGYGYLAAGLSDGSQKFGSFDNGTQVWNDNYTGQKEVNGHWQYWQNGTPVKSTYEWINDQSKETYYDGNGNMVYGQQDINGHWQYFDPETGAQAKNKYVWLTDQNKEVYYNGLGNMVYGQQDINGHWQYFDPQSGAQAKNKYVWLGDQNKEVYYDGSGNMVYGQQKINGYWQYFDPQTGAQAKNKYIWLGDQSKEVYYDGNGNMVYGQQNINGHWQYFDPQTGAQAKNKYVWLGDQNKEVYYDGSGNMVYGQQKINGYWQYFDPQTGAQAKNKYVWLSDQNKEVYYDGNGNMVYGWQKNLLNNHATQYFDPVTGAQYKSGKYTIDGKQYTFNNYGNLVGGNSDFAVRQKHDVQMNSKAQGTPVESDGQIVSSNSVAGKSIASSNGYEWVQNETTIKFIHPLKSGKVDLLGTFNDVSNIKTNQTSANGKGKCPISFNYETPWDADGMTGNALQYVEFAPSSNGSEMTEDNGYTEQSAIKYELQLGGKDPAKNYIGDGTAYDADSPIMAHIKAVHVDNNGDNSAIVGTIINNSTKSYQYDAKDDVVTNGSTWTTPFASGHQVKVVSQNTDSVSFEDNNKTYNLNNNWLNAYQDAQKETASSNANSSASAQPANNPNDVNHDVNGNSSSSATTKPVKEPTDNANTNTSSSSSSSAKPSSATSGHSAQPANNPNDVNHDVNGNDTTTDNKNNVPAVNPSAGNSGEDKPVQKPDGTVAKNPDDITSGSTEPGRPATDDNHSDVNNSGSSSTESTSATESTNVDKQSNSANSNSVNSTNSANTPVNNAEPIVTTTGDDSSSTSDKQVQESNNSNDSVNETSRVASQPQQLVEKQAVPEVGSNSTTTSDNNTQSQAQPVVETAYKPANRPMTQTEQMVVDADNGKDAQATNNSEQGQNTSAKAMPQTGESSNQAMAKIGLSMLGMIAATGIAINKKRFS